MLNFYELFEIDKVEIETPSRVVDDDGDVCEWYIEEQYPNIYPVALELIALMNQYGYMSSFQKDNEAEVEEELKDTLMNVHWELRKIQKDEEFKNNVRDIINDYFTM